jgi:hypothetical protein
VGYSEAQHQRLRVPCRWEKMSSRDEQTRSHLCDETLPDPTRFLRSSQFCFLLCTFFHRFLFFVARLGVVRKGGRRDVLTSHHCIRQFCFLLCTFFHRFLFFVAPFGSGDKRRTTWCPNQSSLYQTYRKSTHGFGTTSKKRTGDVHRRLITTFYHTKGRGGGGDGWFIKLEVSVTWVTEK